MSSEDSLGKGCKRVYKIQSGDGCYDIAYANKTSLSLDTLYSYNLLQVMTVVSYSRIIIPVLAPRVVKSELWKPAYCRSDYIVFFPISSPPSIFLFLLNQ